MTQHEEEKVNQDFGYLFKMPLNVGILQLSGTS